MINLKKLKLLSQKKNQLNDHKSKKNQRARIIAKKMTQMTMNRKINIKTLMILSQIMKKNKDS
jgi:hypothetical protein